MAAEKIAYLPQGRVSYKDYMFLTSMINVRVLNMISYERMQQILMTGDYAAAARLFAESGWPDMAGMDLAGIDRTLSERREKIFNDIESVIPEDEVVEIFRLKYDYHNAKTILKGEKAGGSLENVLSGAGRLPAETLENAWRENDYRFVPATLGHAMAEASQTLAQTENPQLADFILDKAYFAEMRELADRIDPDVEHSPLISAEASEPFMLYYRQLLIDATNLRTVVRCLKMGKDPDFMRLAMLEDGSVGAERLIQSALSGDSLESMFTAMPLSGAAALGMEAAEGGSMTAFEKECDDAILRYLNNMRKMYFNAQLPTWYLTVEETNIQDVRMILKGLLAGIDPERLSERLRETYVL